MSSILYTPLLPWWHREQATKNLESWVYPLIQPRVYEVRFAPGEGSYINFSQRLISVDPLPPKGLEKGVHLPTKIGHTTVTSSHHLQLYWSQMCSWHEAFHALFTEPYTSGKILHWLVNALEDERIERMARWYYPPAWGSFLTFGRLMAQHTNLPDPATRTREQVLIEACLYMRWDWKVPSGTTSRYRFHTPREEEEWRKDIFPLVNKAWMAESTSRVLDLARQILQRIGIDEEKTVADVGILLSSTDPSPRGSRDHNDKALAHFPPPNKSAGVDEEEEIEEISLDTPLSVEEELYLLPTQKLIQQVRGDSNRLLRALLIPTPRVEDEEEELQGMMWNSEDFIQTQGERPFRTPGEKGKAHKGLAIVLLIDTTRSMGFWRGPGLDAHGSFIEEFFNRNERMTPARELAMLFELVCTKANIPLSIGSAGDDGYLEHLPYRRARRKADQPVTWLRTFATPRVSETPRLAIAGLYGKYGRERVNLSLSMSERALDSRREGTKLVIFVHDGKPESESKSAIQLTLEQMRRKGILVFAPFVGEQDEIWQLQEIFGHEWTIPAPTREALITRLSRLLLRYARGPILR